QAAVPAPDGCYPNFTTAEGCDALSLLTTGAGNTGLGWRSLFLDSTGSFNTGVGVERSRSTTRIPTPQWARQRFCSTRPAQRIRQLELTRLSLTTAATATMLSARLRSLTTSSGSATTLLARTRFLKIFPALETLALVIWRSK